MNKALKVVLGLVTAIVIITPFMTFVSWVWFMSSDLPNQFMRYPSTLQIGAVFVFGFPLLIFCSIGVQFILQGYYIVHNITNRIGSNLVRSILGVGTFFLPTIALPVYYCIYILPKTPPKWALDPVTTQSLMPVQPAQ